VRRRHFLIASAVVPFAVRAQARVPRVGILAIPAPAEARAQLDALDAGLREIGYLPGKTILLELRFANGRYADLKPLAQELVAAKVDVIVTFGTPPTQAAKEATTDIPIVMAAAGDPVGTGLVASLARPGGNITGTSNLSPPLVVKRLELLKESHPELRRVALLANPANPAQTASIRAAESASQSLRLELRQYPVRDADAIRKSFATMQADRVEGLLLGNDPLLIGEAAAIAEMATGQRIRSAGNREFAESGGLIGYGSIQIVVRQAAAYVHRILKGAKPAELPIEQPSKYEVFLNLRTAKAGDFSIPPSFRLLRVDRVIE
jgi:putative tryptophan/tyrosine transport system substrate-binding protein